MSDESETTTPGLSVSVRGGLKAAFTAQAKKLYGARGISRSAAEAMSDWLAKYGIQYDVSTDTATYPQQADVNRLRKLAELTELGVDADAILDRALEQAGRPQLQQSVA